MAIIIDLNASEYDQLQLQDPATKQDGGYQRLLVTLQEITDENRRMTLPNHLIPKIQRYAFQYGNGGWEDRLTGILGRSLGPNLSGNTL